MTISHEHAAHVSIDRGTYTSHKSYTVCGQECKKLNHSSIFSCEVLLTLQAYQPSCLRTKNTQVYKENIAHLTNFWNQQVYVFIPSPSSICAGLRSCLQTVTLAVHKISTS